MIQRSAAMAFAPGAWVFPGGRVDPGDVALAAATLPAGADLDDRAACIAAVRETIEEVGLAVGLDPLPPSDALAAIRAALHGGESFADLLARFRLRLMLENLLSFSRWQPPEDAPRRFDTRFYIARAPEMMTVTVDGAEAVASRWTTAGDVLVRTDMRTLFPTMCNLRRIAAHQSFADLAAHSAAFPSRLIVAEVRSIAGKRHICVPYGHGYPAISMLLSDVSRG